jgi:hypothetical protein
MEEKQPKIDPELKEIILYRILSSKLPDTIKMSIGGIADKEMTMSEIAGHVKAEDEIGRIVIEMELNYLKALKEGLIPKIQNA